MTDDDWKQVRHDLCVAAVVALAFVVLLYGFPKVTRWLYDVPRVIWTLDSCANAIPESGV